MHILPPPQIVEREEDCLALLDEMLRQSRVALDTETTGTNRSSDVVDCWSVSFRRNNEEPPVRVLLPAHRLFLFQPFFASRVEKVFHRSIFDLSMLRNSGIPDVNGPILDTLIMDALLDENREGLHDLKQCGFDYLGIVMASFEESFKGVPLHQLSLEEKAPYATLDAYVTLLLSEVFERELRKETIGESGRTLWDLYMKFYPRFAKLIAEMSMRGWAIHRHYLENLEPLLVRDMAEIDYQFNVFATQWCASQGISLHDYTWERGSKVIKTKPVYPGGFISLTKREQLIHFFTEVQSLPVLGWTEGGVSGKKSPAISEDVLLKYSGEYKNNFASLLLQRRGLEKSLATYIRGLLGELDQHGQIHAELKIMGARTGRLSCKEPNLQSFPRPDNDNYNLRKAFVAPQRMLLIVADYAQLEVRIAASLSGDPVLCNSILQGLDLHSFTAANMFGEFSYEKIVWGNENKKNKDLSEDERKLAKKLSEMRSAAKAILFGLFYGRGAQSLAVELDLMRKHHLSFEDAKEMARDMIQRFFEVYPVLQNFIKSTQETCRRQEYVRTWLGRKRRLPAMNSKDKKMRAEAERQCFNSVIQGSAADIAMVAMLECAEDDFLQAHQCQLLMQVHDELIFQVPYAFAEDALVRVKHKMESPFAKHFRVPMEVSAGVALNWSDAK